MRTIEEIVFTGAYSADESQRLREAGYRWTACRWCGVTVYVQPDGLCGRCGVQHATEQARREVAR